MAEDGTISRPVDELKGDERLLAELVRGASLVDAATAAGMPERTARRHAAAPEFREKLEAARGDLREAMVRQLEAAVGRAVRRLDELAQNAERESDQIAAARALVQHMPGLVTTAEIRARLEEVERSQGVGGQCANIRS